MLAEMLSAAVIGDPETVRQGIEAFAARTGADELMVTSQAFEHTARLRSFEIVARETLGYARDSEAVSDKR